MDRLRYAAVGALLIQAFLLFSHPGLLPLWGDELFTLRTVQQRLPQMFETLQNDIHPPLYFLAQRYWIRIPLFPDLVVRLRVLSAIFALMASAYALWFFLPRLTRRAGLWFCAILALSPCLILYGRMARSYSLQLLVSLIAIHQLLRLLKSPAETKLAIWFGLALALALYTHYTPGASIATAGSLVLLIRARSLKPVLIANGVALLAYSPWIATLAIALGRWERKADFYRVTGKVISEEVVKLGYWTVSLLFGESIPWWLFLAEIPLGIMLAWLAWQGIGSAREWLIPVGLVAAIGYVSASRWVTFPFIPARMLFVLPFFYLLLVYGFQSRPWAGGAILSALLFCSVAGLWNYYKVSGYLNWGYAVPYTDIARQITSSSQPTVVAAGVFTDASVLTYFLPAGIPYRSIDPQPDAEQAARDLAAGPWSRLCMVRNTHDASPNEYYTHLEQALARSFPRQQTFFYRPRTTLDFMLVRLLGWKNISPYFYEVIEFQR